MKPLYLAGIFLLCACNNVTSSFSVKEDTEIKLFTEDNYAQVFDDFTKILKSKLYFGKNSYSIVGFNSQLNLKLTRSMQKQGASVCSLSQSCSGISLRLEEVELKNNLILLSIKTPDFTLSRIYQKQNGQVLPFSQFTLQE